MPDDYRTPREPEQVPDAQLAVPDLEVDEARVDSARGGMLSATQASAVKKIDALTIKQSLGDGSV